MSEKKRLVVYHASCIDGFTAAWVAWQKFDDSAEYLPARYGDPPPPCAGREVYVLDFSYPRETMLAMHAEAKSLLVLDHHKTAQEALAGLDFAIFDMNRSGAGLAWDCIAPHSRTRGKPRPWLVDYVEDQDLWRFALLNSKAVNAWIATHDRTFGTWSCLNAQPLAAGFGFGEAILAFIKQYVAQVKENARMVEVPVSDGPATNPQEVYRVPLVNCSHVLTSEVVGELAEGHPFAIGWRQRSDGKYAYSLRSRKGGVDVSEIAKRFGGGGHPGAAGFERREIPRGWA